MDVTYFVFGYSALRSTKLVEPRTTHSAGEPLVSLSVTFIHSFVFCGSGNWSSALSPAAELGPCCPCLFDVAQPLGPACSSRQLEISRTGAESAGSAANSLTSPCQPRSGATETLAPNFSAARCLLSWMLCVVLTPTLRNARWLSASPTLAHISLLVFSGGTNVGVPPCIS